MCRHVSTYVDLLEFRSPSITLYSDIQAGLSSDFSAASAGVGLIRNCSAALVPVLADKMEQLFQCVVMPTYAMSESGSDR